LYSVKIIGAGQLGSRHLQALHTVKTPLRIEVIDPAKASLAVAQERYESLGKNDKHQIGFFHKTVDMEPTDIAIIATSSNVRRKVLEELLSVSSIKFAILEKLLFDVREDYAAVGGMLDQSSTRAWVNCPMRVMPVYEKIRANLQGMPISYRVTGSQFGLVTNAIHYIDHVSHLTGCAEYELETGGLDRTPIISKRAGFLEFNGTLVARFADGSRLEMACYPSGNAPVVVEIFNQSHRYIVRESEGKLWRSSVEGGWVWYEEPAPIPYQSQITAGVVESLLKTGECGLAPYPISAKLHLALLEPLLNVVQINSPQAVAFQFT
jgi:hypothetical protein